MTGNEHISAMLNAVPEVSEFWLLRGNGTVSISPCPDHPGAWHWQFIPTVPKMVTVPTGQAMVDEQGRVIPETKEIEVMPDQIHTDLDHLLSLLSPDEVTAFRGYSAHLQEHVETHIEHVLGSMPNARAERRFDALNTLTDELHACLVMRQCITEACSAAYHIT